MGKNWIFRIIHCIYFLFKVLAVVPHTAAEVTWLADFKDTPSLNCSLDWWSEPGQVEATVSMAVGPDCYAQLIQLLKSNGFSVSVAIPDIEKEITLEKNYRALSLLHRVNFDWNEEVYHPLAEINERIDWLASQHSDLVSTQVLATTHEMRDIEVIIVREPGPITKPVIWIDCGIHAREWVSPPTCLHAVDRLIDGVNSIDNLLSAYDFYILPVANPDGYVYTWTTNRMWRKNRRPMVGAERPINALPNCYYGVDPNRNFPANFGGPGASGNPCRDDYRGLTPFSEAESIAIREGITNMTTMYGSGRIAAFVSIHAYSQYWLSPFGYKTVYSNDHDDQMYVMNKSVEALGEVYGTNFTYGPISEVKQSSIVIVIPIQELIIYPMLYDII